MVLMLQTAGPQVSLKGPWAVKPPWITFYTQSKRERNEFLHSNCPILFLVWGKNYTPPPPPQIIIEFLNHANLVGQILNCPLGR
jgi:hypothetical protein